MSWLKQKEKPEVIEQQEEEVKPVIKTLKKVQEQPKVKVIVVKELPVQRINTITDKQIIKQYTDEDIDELHFITTEEALTELMND